MNNATSSDVCRFEHLIDLVSRFPEAFNLADNSIGISTPGCMAESAIKNVFNYGNGSAGARRAFSISGPDGTQSASHFVHRIICAASFQGQSHVMCGRIPHNQKACVKTVRRSELEDSTPA